MDKGSEELTKILNAIQKITPEEFMIWYDSIKEELENDISNTKPVRSRGE